MRILLAVVVLGTSTFASAHPGGLDANGGHYNRKTGEYHYHRKVAAPAAPVNAPAPEPPPKKSHPEKSSPQKTSPVLRDFVGEGGAKGTL